MKILIELMIKNIYARVVTPTAVSTRDSCTLRTHVTLTLTARVLSFPIFFGRLTSHLYHIVVGAPYYTVQCELNGKIRYQ